MPVSSSSSPSHLGPTAHSLALLRRICSYNVETVRSSPLSELSGSLGDLGTLLPLFLALTIGRSIYLAPTLLVTGLANIFTGLIFGVPLPVQPMKAIAAVAIAKNYTVEETMASGLSMGIAIAVLTVTGLLGSNETSGSKSRDGGNAGRPQGWGLMRWVPVPVVKGIQVGAGLSLCISAGEKMLTPWIWTGRYWGDGMGWALAAAMVVLVSDVAAIRTNATRIPAALIIFIAGLGLAVVQIRERSMHATFDASGSAFNHGRFQHLPSWPRTETFSRTFSTALGQLPLTTLNSILAVTYLAGDLYPSGFPPAPSPGALGLSVSAMNIIGCVFGAMPTCHGSGGLAGQYKFGARSGASIILLGSVKTMLAVIALGSNTAARSMIRILEAFPKGMLGIMVIAAGVELAKVGANVNDDARDLWEEVEDYEPADEETPLIQHWEASSRHHRRQRHLSPREKRERFTVMVVTTAVLLAFRNDGIGFIAGMVWHCALRIPSAWERMQSYRHASSSSSRE